MTRRLAIIPARKGSKRIPDKNIRDFCGRPMITHALGRAIESGVFSEIHVSTDSDEIAAAAAAMEHKPAFMRPDRLSGDQTSMMEVIRYVVEQYKQSGVVFETVVLIYATSPLIDPNDIKDACEKFESGNKQKAMLAVTEYPAPIEHAFRMDEKGDLNPDSAESLAMRTQDLKKAYYDAGMFAIYTTDYILKQTAGGDFKGFSGFLVSSYRVTDIDWPEDWERAEKMYKALQ